MRRIVYVLPQQKEMRDDSKGIDNVCYIDQGNEISRKLKLDLKFEVFDLKKKYTEKDWFIFINFYDWSKKYYKFLKKNKLLKNTIYWMMEPETVISFHSQEGVNEILKFFHYVITWRMDLVDSKRVFYTIVPLIIEQRESRLGYRTAFTINEKDSDISKRTNEKLLVNISGNKYSTEKKELYSERRKIIRFFSDFYPEQFELYGPGWNIEEFSTYKGKCETKLDVYQRFKFALCLENTRIKGNISEKIFDCLIAGIVPIYAGPEDSDNFVPPNVYISYDKFESIEELSNYIINMSDDEYGTYLLNAHNFLNSTEIDKYKYINVIKSVTGIMDMCSNFEFEVKVYDTIVYMLREIRKSIRLKISRSNLGKIYRKMRNH